MSVAVLVAGLNEMWAQRDALEALLVEAVRSQAYDRLDRLFIAHQDGYPPAPASWLAPLLWHAEQTAGRTDHE